MTRQAVHQRSLPVTRPARRAGRPAQQAWKIGDRQPSDNRVRLRAPLRGSRVSGRRDTGLQGCGIWPEPLHVNVNVPGPGSRSHSLRGLVERGSRTTATAAKAGEPPDRPRVKNLQAAGRLLKGGYGRSLAALVRSYESARRRAPRSLADLPTSTPQADAFAKQLKAQGYRFVGPTSVYAFMQNVGVVNDHIRGCFRATDYRQRPTKPRRAA